MSKPDTELKSSSTQSMKEHRDQFADINARNEFEKNNKEMLFFAKNHSQNIAVVTNLTSDWQSGQVLSAMFNEFVGDYMFPEKMYCTAVDKTPEERIAALDVLFGLIEKELKVPKIIEAKDWIDTEYPPERFSMYFYLLEVWKAMKKRSTRKKSKYYNRPAPTEEETLQNESKIEKNLRQAIEVKDVEKIKAYIKDLTEHNEAFLTKTIEKMKAVKMYDPSCDQLIKVVTALPKEIDDATRHKYKKVTVFQPVQCINCQEMITPVYGYKCVQCISIVHAHCCAIWDERVLCVAENTTHTFVPKKYYVPVKCRHCKISIGIGSQCIYCKMAAHDHHVDNLANEPCLTAEERYELKKYKCDNCRNKKCEEMKQKLDTDHPKSKEMTKEAKEARKKARKLLFKTHGCTNEFRCVCVCNVGGMHDIAQKCGVLIGGSLLIGAGIAVTIASAGTAAPLVAAGIAVVGGCAIGVGAGMTINAASATIKGEKIDGKDLLVDATIGGLCGGVGGGLGVASGVGAGMAIGYVGASHLSTGAMIASTHAINVGANVTQGVMTGIASEVITDTIEVKVGRKDASDWGNKMLKGAVIGGTVGNLGNAIQAVGVGGTNALVGGGEMADTIVDVLWEEKDVVIGIVIANEDKLKDIAQGPNNANGQPAANPPDDPNKPNTNEVDPNAPKKLPPTPKTHKITASDKVHSQHKSKSNRTSGEKKKDKEKADGPLDVLAPMRVHMGENSGEETSGDSKKERKSGKRKDGSPGSDKKSSRSSSSSLGSASSAGSASSSASGSRSRLDKDGEKKHKRPHKNLTVSQVQENHLQLLKYQIQRQGSEEEQLALLKTMWSMTDRDENGWLDYVECQAFFGKLYDMWYFDDNKKRPLEKPEVRVKVVELWTKKFDLNGDGVVNWSEFTTVMRQSVENDSLFTQIPV